MLIGGLDVGTTGCKLTLYNQNGEFIHNEYLEYEVKRQNGEHEIDAEAIWESVRSVIQKTGEQYSEISAIGITTFGETFVALDQDDRVLLPSMLYTDPRGEEEAKELCEKLGEENIIRTVGVKPHSMYSFPKIMWIKKHLPEVYQKISKILLMEDFIVYSLCKEAVIDYSLAARTMAFDIRNKCWWQKMFEVAGIDSSLMSTPAKTGTAAGKITKELANELGINENLLIVCCGHDQVASTLGAGVFEAGQAVDGTGTVECITPVFDSIPENPELYEQGYSVVPFVFEDTYVCYAFSFTGGAVLKWYRDQFARMEQKLAEEEGKNVYQILDSKIPENPTDILILPHFAGAATPYMDSDSKAAVIGLTLEHTSEDFYKALMEGVTYEMMINLKKLNQFGIKPQSLTATGGGATSKVWLQIKADILQKEIFVLEAKEVGACGSCMLAGVAAGAFSDLQEARKQFVKVKASYQPNPEKKMQYQKNFNAYEMLYPAVRPIVDVLKKN